MKNLERFLAKEKGQKKAKKYLDDDHEYKEEKADSEAKEKPAAAEKPKSDAPKRESIASYKTKTPTATKVSPSTEALKKHLGL